MTKKPTLHEIKGVEIFRTGEWNGDEYDTSDIDDMIANFDKVGYRPAIMLGHSTEIGAPAVGWIGRIYRKGEVLFADLIDVADEVYEMIRRRSYDFVSAEIYWNLKRGGKIFKRALKAIALLGSEVPAVAGLAPLRTVVNDMPAGDVRTYLRPRAGKFDITAAEHDILDRYFGQQQLLQHYFGNVLDRDHEDDDDGDHLMNSPDDPIPVAAPTTVKLNSQRHTMERPDIEAHNRAVKLTRQQHGMTYSEAVRLVFAEDDTLRRAYNSFAHLPDQSRGEGGAWDIPIADEKNPLSDPSAEITRLAFELMNRTPDLNSFGDAVNIILQTRPDLSAAYAKWHAPT